MFNRQQENLMSAGAEERATWRVALVAMPFLAAESPSIQLGLLKSIAESRGFPVTTFHFNLDFAAQIGFKPYTALCGLNPHRLGEWLFSIEAFGADAPDPDDRLLEQMPPEIVGELEGHGLARERLRALRHEEAPKYLDYLLAAVPWEEFRVVGFTSSFEQNTASFALARRLKERFPDLIIVFGGANFDGEMGLEWVRSVACIDYAVIGEGDQAFPELLSALQSGRDPAQTPGVVCRRDGQVTPLKTRPLFNRLDELPVPDYGEFFQRLDALGFLSPSERRKLRLPFESARGCWWGAKHHCTFCGLNGNGMPFRAKSPGRVMAELAELARRHHSFDFYAVDNILDMSYVKNFFARLRDDGCDYQFFYEVKSNLTRAQIKTLREGGVRHIQPGIESLNSRVLRLMRKGVTAIQNVNTLRWAVYYDIKVAWNLLYGFPGETVEDYQQQLELLRQITHLEPPLTRASRILMERFSPLYEDRKSFPARHVRPDGNYKYIYPKRVSLDRAVYFFDYELEEALPESVFDETQEQVRVWQERWRAPRRPQMTFRRAPGFLEIEDRRDQSKPRAYSVAEPRASLYAACSDEPHTAATLRNLLGLRWQAARIEKSLEDFRALGLMMREGDQFLSLALPASRWR
jgi:ribosomal peptide maturation radical SAM protein 1